nr:5379_t:CDS:2 [Entrophospora candida]CAG8591661.1 5542_t:CDS:2 [Entrophospora candida]
MTNRTKLIIANILVFISFVFLLLVNLGTTVIQSIFIMKYEINNITVQLGLYGSCVGSNFTNPLHPESLLECAKGGMINGIGTSGTKFLAAMHPMGDILIFKDGDSAASLIGEVTDITNSNQKFGAGFGLAIGALPKFIVI